MPLRASERDTRGPSVPFQAVSAPLHQLVKALFARFLHCKVTVFPFILNNYLVKRYLENYYHWLIFSPESAVTVVIAKWCFF